MLAKVCFFTLLTAVAAKTSWNQLDNYTFEQFTQEFGLKYESSELANRRSLFTAELTRVRAHNAKNLSWKEGVNKFSAMTAAEKKAFHGRAKSTTQVQHKSLQHAQGLPEDFKIESIESLPTEVDWRTKGIVTAVKDQGHCGSCWAFAATATIESHVAKATGLLFDLSTQQVAMCSPNPLECGGTGGCQGGTHEIAYEYASSSKGIYQMYQYGYDAYYGENAECKEPASTPVAAIDGYVRLPENNYLALMNAVAKVGPVAVTVDASTWHAYDSGIHDGCDQVNPDLNHGVVLVGYGEENGQGYWLVRNSWNPTYGEQGYIRVARTKFEQYRCGLDVNPQDGVACKGETDPVTACGTCGILYDSSYPLNAGLVAK